MADTANGSKPSGVDKSSTPDKAPTQARAKRGPLGGVRVLAWLGVFLAVGGGIVLGSLYNNQRQSISALSRQVTAQGDAQKSAGATAARLSALEKRLDARSRSQAGAMAGLKGEVRALSKSSSAVMGDMRRRLDAMSRSHGRVIAGLKSQIAALSKSRAVGLRELRQRLDGLKSQIAALSKSRAVGLRELRQRLDGLRPRRTALVSQVKALEGTVGRMRRGLGTLGATLERSGKAADANAKQFKTTFDRLSGGFAGFEKSVKEIEARLTASEEAAVQGTRQAFVHRCRAGHRVRLNRWSATAKPSEAQRKRLNGAVGKVCTCLDTKLAASGGISAADRKAIYDQADFVSGWAPAGLPSVMAARKAVWKECTRPLQTVIGEVVKEQKGEQAE